MKATLLQIGHRVQCRMIVLLWYGPVFKSMDSLHIHGKNFTTYNLVFRLFGTLMDIN